MSCSIGYYIKAGVLQPLPAGGLKAKVCHSEWLDYWMNCRKPANPFFPFISDDKWDYLWKRFGWLKQLGSCPCQPKCDGKECGNDGCNGSCGTCVDGQQCQAGMCECQPDCSGKECGEDGCEGSCGECEDYQECVDGWCWHHCAMACVDKDCGPSEDGDCICGSCPPGMMCNDGKCVCQPACDDKNCGDDGCDGSCGECTGQNACVDGVCTCEPACDGKECGDDGCDGSCGVPGETGCCDGEVAHGCFLGVPYSFDCETIGKKCGWNFYGQYYNCGAGLPPPEGGPPQACPGTGEPEDCGEDCEACCAEKECTPEDLQSKCDCGSCLPGDHCSDAGLCCSNSASLDAEYIALLNDPGIAAALELKFWHKQLLEQAILQLECGDTSAWSAYASLASDCLLESQMRQVWLRRVAISLYLERHQVYPWRLVDYSDWELKLLLSWDDWGGAQDLLTSEFGEGSFHESNCPGDCWDTGVLWFDNPLIARKLTAELHSGHVFQTAGDALTAATLILQDFIDNWYHEGGGESWAELGFGAKPHAACGGWEPIGKWGFDWVASVWCFALIRMTGTA